MLFVRTFVEKINIISIQLMIPTRVLKLKLWFYVLCLILLSVISEIYFAKKDLKNSSEHLNIYSPLCN